MQAILICGSPRNNGNTEQLLKHCAQRLQAEAVETEIIPLRGKKIHGCTACGGCAKRHDGTCTIDDDDFHPIFRKMRDADIIVVGSPVYFGSATPELMALLDRAGFISRANGGNFFSRKVGGAVAVARRAGHNFTFAQLMFWFLINDLIVPGSSYWNVAFGRNPGEVNADTEGFDTVSRFAENLAWVAKKLNA